MDKIVPNGAGAIIFRFEPAFFIQTGFCAAAFLRR